MNRVLIAEDDPDTREAVAGALRDRDWEVVAVANGEDALRECALQDPDVVIVDVLLPGMAAAAFVRAYRKLPGSRAKLIAMSGLPRVREVARRIGCDDAFGKPFRLSDLVAAVERLAKGRLLRSASRVV